MTPAAEIALATGLAVAGLLVAEHRGSRAGKCLAKPLASTGFLLVALAQGALDHGYGRAVLGALALGWLGDVLLLSEGVSRAFRAGLASFLLGHLAFAAAFALRGLDAAWLAGGGLAVLALALPVLLWLRPHVPDPMRVPVAAYVTVISLMVASAAGSFGAGAPGLVLLGAVLFFFSDLAVARERFVAKNFTNKLWGLPFYYGGQLLLAASVGS
jgi:uncharacterized membrane protein YhhN